MILVNGEPFNERINPASFVTLNRLWNNGDKVEIIFKYNFHYKNMLDNKNVIALFYGPVLLAFETEKELILKGSHEETLRSLSKPNNEFSFNLKNNRKTFKLIPFYKITNDSYSIYATIRNEY